jgi:hypothetical protein
MSADLKLSNELMSFKHLWKGELRIMPRDDG